MTKQPKIHTVIVAAVPAKPNLGERSPHWGAVRAAHLKAHPVCEACGTNQHLEVHHRAPFHLHKDLELAESNLITLCESPSHACHFYCGHLLDWHSWNPDVVHDAATIRYKIAHRPK